MEKLIVHKNTSSVDWKPSPIIALATSPEDGSKVTADRKDNSKVAAAREDGSLEIWRFSPGSVGWHCQLTIHGDPNSRVTSLVWCRSNCKTKPDGRLLSSSIDGSISEWDLFHLKQKVLIFLICFGVFCTSLVLEIEMGVSIDYNFSRNVQTAVKTNLCQKPVKLLVYPRINEKSTKSCDCTDLLISRMFSMKIALILSCYDDYFYEIGVHVVQILLDSIGISIWKMAVEPLDPSLVPTQNDTQGAVNGHATNTGTSLCDDDNTESDDDHIDAVELHPMIEDPRLAIGCDDGCVRLYIVSDSDQLTYNRTFPRVSGRVLSVAWSSDAKSIFSGSSDGFIRCWDAQSNREVYRITVGTGGLHNRSDLCVWSLIYLKSSTLVSGDSTGSVQFWDGEQGTLLQAHSCHKGDVNALASSPSHNEVFSAGSDGQVIQYKLSCDTTESGNASSSTAVVKKWVYVGYVRAHTHDVRALTVALPSDGKEPLPDKKLKRERRREPSYWKWPNLRVPMLFSAGDDAKLFAYSAQEFTKFSPHDICPAPQRVPIQLVQNTLIDGASMILVQNSNSLDVSLVQLKSGKDSRKGARTSLFTSIKSRSKIICSTMSCSGMLFKNASTLAKKELPSELPFAHSMVFSADSSNLIIAGHDRKIYVVKVKTRKLLHTFTPSRDANSDLPPSEPPVTRMFASSDGQWLSAVNCFGDIYVFDLEKKKGEKFLYCIRQHCFVYRLDEASVSAGGFMMTQEYGIVLIITTSTNQVYVFDVKAKKLIPRLMAHTHPLPTRFQEFPGEIIGMSFPQPFSTAVIIYSARAMCFIDFEKLLAQDGHDNCLANGVLDSSSEVSQDVAANGNGKVNHKRKRENQKNLNFNFSPFKDPALFVGHLSESSVLVIEKPWREVVQSFEAPPVHKHIYGT
ncbi:hypothetical protein MKW92_028189 [Papaver armeniacum]|nr:hypothetical protein MKW92_028189 [Papaver armeniacum]